ncbi:MAG: hypothetical protein K5641_02150 [Lachnospiraceae bacterium]|nr:hypothetical protein [Lachnospiraceae bacterium]
MKRKLLIIATAACMLFSSMTALAAPKTMPDGGTFDADYYAATYSDVKAAFGNNEAMLYQHYKLCGAKEGRHPYAVGASVATSSGSSSSTTTDDFDAAYYASKYPDLMAVFGTDATKLYQHWITCGKKEGRIAKAPEQKKEEEKEKSSGSSDLDDNISDHATLAKQLLYLVNVYRLDKGRKELKMNDQLVTAANRLAIGNDDDDKSSSKTNDRDYKKLAKESSYVYDEIDCSHFKTSDDKPEEIFQKLRDEDSDMLKEKVYRDFGYGKCGKYHVFIFANEE